MSYTFDNDFEDGLLDIVNSIKIEAKEVQHEIPKKEHPKRLFLVPPLYANSRYDNVSDDPKDDRFIEAIKDTEKCLIEAEGDYLPITESYDIIPPTYVSLSDALEMTDVEICSYIRSNINIVQ